MRAVDTNVLARLALADNEIQYSRAAALMDEPLWVPITVWLELGWVLSKQLGMTRGAICDAILAILLSDNVHTADRTGLRWAIDRFRAGADWADSLHLVAVKDTADTFTTFDRQLLRQAGDAPPVAIETLA